MAVSGGDGDKEIGRESAEVHAAREFENWKWAATTYEGSI